MSRPGVGPLPVVFLGPSLPVAQARAVLEADYRPPVARGDLDALPEGVTTVGIVDGDFYQRLSVSPKEVLRALRAGVRVYGSSSMGALRAAELHRYGMVGIGRVFELYRDGAVDADDEVALTYTREDCRPTSLALVNVRLALGAALRAGLLTEAEAGQLLERLRDTYFPDRSLGTLRRLVAQVIPAGRREELLTAVENAPDVKRLDALDLLRRIRADRPAP